MKARLCLFLSIFIFTQVINSNAQNNISPFYLLQASSKSYYTIPITLTREYEIEAITLKLVYNKEIIRFEDVSLMGGILEQTDMINYGLHVGVLANKGEINISLPAYTNVISGKGDVMFIKFKILNNINTMNVLSLNHVEVNELSVNECGFRINNNIYKVINIYNRTLFDVNNDHKQGMQDIIYYLKCISGIIKNKNNVNILDVVQTLQRLSFYEIQD